VALKRLGIAMHKVIHVEHVMIAMHVVQYQHDSNYNKSLSDDGIEHVYYSKFEMVENDLDDFMEDHTAPLILSLVDRPVQTIVV